MACTEFPECGCVGFCKFGPTANKPTGVPRQKTVVGYRVGHGVPCPYCGIKMDADHRWHHPTQDHIVPRSRGGRHEQYNLVVACATCNQDKADQTLIEWHRFLVQTRDPRAPHVANFIRTLRAIKEEPPRGVDATPAE